ncbi:MAG: membrane dipeptidase, partial [Candidatus Adiutricales bacterium]
DDKMLEKLAENGGVIQICVLSAFVKTPEPYPERDSALKAFREKFDQSTALSGQDQESALEEFKKINEKFPPELATVKDAVDHIEHAVKIAGIDHVGIGTDFDGGGGLKDCFDVSELGNITAELINRKYTDDQIAKIWGGNFIRVFRRAQDA